MALTEQLSLDDFLAQPDPKPYREYLYGRVIAKAMPKRTHSLLQSYLARLLWNWVEDTGGGEVMSEPRCVLATPGERHVQLPDVAWFSNTPELQNDDALTPPELVVEVLSPSDPFGRVQQKVRIYLDAGVRIVLVVDPSVRTMSVCRRSQEPVVLEEGAVFQDPLLPGLSLALTDVFRPLRS